MGYQVSEFSLKVTDQAFEDIKNYHPAGSDDDTLGLICMMLCAISQEYEQLRSAYNKRAFLMPRGRVETFWNCAFSPSGFFSRVTK